MIEENDRMNEEIRVEQHLIEDRDLYSLAHTTQYNIERCRSPKLRDQLLRIKSLFDLSTMRCVGEGVETLLIPGEGLVSNISYGYATWFYMTDHVEDSDDFIVTQDYKEAILDIVGLIKDGYITRVELYARKNWRIELGDPLLDNRMITYMDSREKTYKAVDRFNLLAILVPEYERLNIIDHIDVVSAIKIIPDNQDTGEGVHRLYLQDGLTGIVTCELS